MVTKNSIIMSEIVAKYHPRFRKADTKALALSMPEVFHTPLLVEQSMAAVGGYKFIDGEHCDFDDGSECKTASIRVNGSGTSVNSFATEISNVISPGGVYKSGDIRLVMFNPHTNGLEYYFLPWEDWTEMKINIHPTTNYGRIMTTYNKSKNTIKLLNDFKISTFRQLALT